MFLAAFLDRQRRQSSSAEGADLEESGLQALQRIAKERTVGSRRSDVAISPDKEPASLSREAVRHDDKFEWIASTGIGSECQNQNQNQNQPRMSEGPASAAVAAAQRFAASAVSSFTSSSLLNTKARILATVLGSDDPPSSYEEEDLNGCLDETEGRGISSFCSEEGLTQSAEQTERRTLSDDFKGKRVAVSSLASQASSASSSLTTCAKWSQAQLAEAEAWLLREREDLLSRCLEKRGSSLQEHRASLEEKAILPDPKRWTEIAPQVNEMLKRKLDRQRREDEAFFSPQMRPRDEASPFSARGLGDGGDASTEAESPAPVSLASDDVWSLLSEESKLQMQNEAEAKMEDPTVFLQTLLNRIRTRIEEVEAERLALSNQELEEVSAVSQAASFAVSLWQLKEDVCTLQREMRDAASREEDQDHRLSIELQDALEALALQGSKKEFLHRLIQLMNASEEAAALLQRQAEESPLTKEADAFSHPFQTFEETRILLLLQRLGLILASGALPPRCAGLGARRLLSLLPGASKLAVRAAQKAASEARLWRDDEFLTTDAEIAEAPCADPRSLDAVMQTFGVLMLLQRLHVLANATEELSNETLRQTTENKACSSKAPPAKASSDGGRHEALRRAMRVYGQLHPLDRWECAAFVEPLLTSFQFHFMREEGGALQRLERPDWPVSFLLSRLRRMQERLASEGEASLEACATRLAEGSKAEISFEEGESADEDEASSWLFGAPSSASCAEDVAAARKENEDSEASSVSIGASARLLLCRAGSEAVHRLPFEEAAAVHAARSFRLLLLQRFPFLLFAGASFDGAEKRGIWGLKEGLVENASRTGASTLALLHLDQLQKLAATLRPVSVRAVAELARDLDADTPLRSPFSAEDEASEATRKEGLSLDEATEAWDEDALDWTALDAETDKVVASQKPEKTNSPLRESEERRKGDEDKSVSVSQETLPSTETWRIACATGPLDLTLLLKGAVNNATMAPANTDDGSAVGMLQLLVNFDGLYLQREVEDLMKAGAATRRCTDTAAAAAAISPEDHWVAFSSLLKAASNRCSVLTSEAALECYANGVVAPPLKSVVQSLRNEWNSVEILEDPQRVARCYCSASFLLGALKDLEFSWRIPAEFGELEKIHRKMWAYIQQEVTEQTQLALFRLDEGLNSLARLLPRVANLTASLPEEESAGVFGALAREVDEAFAAQAEEALKQGSKEDRRRAGRTLQSMCEAALGEMKRHFADSAGLLRCEALPFTQGAVLLRSSLRRDIASHQTLMQKLAAKLKREEQAAKDARKSGTAFEGPLRLVVKQAAGALSRGGLSFALSHQVASEEKELSKPEVVASDLVEEEAEKEEAHIRALLAEAGVPSQDLRKALLLLQLKSACV